MDVDGTAQGATEQDRPFGQRSLQAPILRPALRYLDGAREELRRLRRQVKQLRIENWCNPHRRHSALGYLSPIDYEARRKAA